MVTTTTRKKVPAKRATAETKARRKIQPRLAPDVVKRIKAASAKGTPDATIAERTGATKRTVSRIRRGRVYVD